MFDKKEIQFLLQGITALQQECSSHKGALLQKQMPDDTNLHTLIEYYDKRGVELQKLKVKLSGQLNP